MRCCDLHRTLLHINLHTEDFHDGSYRKAGWTASRRVASTSTLQNHNDQSLSFWTTTLNINKQHCIFQNLSPLGRQSRPHCEILYLLHTLMFIIDVSCFVSLFIGIWDGALWFWSVIKTIMTDYHYSKGDCGFHVNHQARMESSFIGSNHELLAAVRTRTLPPRRHPYLYTYIYADTACYWIKQDTWTNRYIHTRKPRPLMLLYHCNHVHFTSQIVPGCIEMSLVKYIVPQYTAYRQVTATVSFQSLPSCAASFLCYQHKDQNASTQLNTDRKGKDAGINMDTHKASFLIRISYAFNMLRYMHAHN